MAKNIAEKAKVGISACLLGYNVRYNGKNKYDGKLVAMLCRHFVLVPFCPEVEAGLGVPRTPIVLQNIHGQIRALQGSHDVSDRLALLGKKLASLNLDGYVFKSNSPSCGLHVPMDHRDETTRGVFAAALLANNQMAVVEDVDLRHDKALMDFMQALLQPA